MVNILLYVILVLPFKIIYLVFMYMTICLDVYKCPHVMECLQRPEEDVESPEIGC